MSLWKLGNLSHIAAYFTVVLFYKNDGILAAIIIYNYSYYNFKAYLFREQHIFHEK